MPIRAPGRRGGGSETLESVYEKDVGRPARRTPHGRKIRARIAKPGLARLLILLCGLSAAVAAFADAGALEDRLRQLEALQTRVEARIREALELRSQLITRRRELVDEIKDLGGRLQIRTYSTAEQNLRIHYDLLLIGMLETYAERLQQRLDSLLEIGENLQFLHRQAEDELKILRSFHTVENGRLAARIDDWLDRHRREVEKQLISSGEVGEVSAEAIWRAVAEGRI